MEEGNADTVKICLRQCAGFNCKFKDILYTPQLLLETAANKNTRNKWQETPLLIPATSRHCAVVEALLENRADSSLCSNKAKFYGGHISAGESRRTSMHVCSDRDSQLDGHIFFTKFVFVILVCISLLFNYYLLTILICLHMTSALLTTSHYPC